MTLFNELCNDAQICSITKTTICTFVSGSLYKTLLNKHKQETFLDTEKVTSEIELGKNGDKKLLVWKTGGTELKALGQLLRFGVFRKLLLRILC